MNNRYDVGNVEETWAVAKAFAAELKPGDVLITQGAGSVTKVGPRVLENMA